MLKVTNAKYRHILQRPEFLFMLQVCYDCLTPLRSPTARQGVSQGRFCSQTCEQQALPTYHDVEAALDLAPLQQYCQAYDERFPLLIARAACMKLSQQFQHAEAGSHAAVAVETQGSNVPQGDFWQVQLAMVT